MTSRPRPQPRRKPGNPNKEPCVYRDCNRPWTTDGGIGVRYCDDHRKIYDAVARQAHRDMVLGVKIGRDPFRNKRK